MINARYLQLLNECPLLPIKSEVELQAALAMLSRYGSSEVAIERDYCAVLIALMGEYEKQVVADLYELRDGPELLASFMEDHQLTNKQITEIAGVSRQKISDYLHRRSSLSKQARDKLGRHFAVNGSLFEYSPARDRLVCEDSK